MDQILTISQKLDNSLLGNQDEEFDKTACELTNVVLKVEFAGSDPITWLETLESPLQTIPYIFSLSKYVESVLASGKAVSRQIPPQLLPDGQLWPCITKALIEFDPIQVRYVGHSLSKIVDVVVSGAEQTSNLVPAIQLLQHVILRLDPTSSTLTKIHVAYVRLSLLAGAYLEATTVLDAPIYYITSQETAKQAGDRGYKFLCSTHDTSAAYLNPETGLAPSLTHRQYLEYFFMGALCYIGSHQLPKAQTFLEVVLSAPSQQNVASLIQVEAYKKWLLLGLLVDGKGSDLPRTVNPSSCKHIRALSKAYEGVVEAFKSGKIEQLQGEIQEGLDTWQQDCNYGLISEVIAAFRKFSVLKLSKTFSALSVEEVARRTSATPDDVLETLTYIRSMIASGEIHAEILPAKTSTSSGTLRFLPTPASQMSEAEVEQQLALQTKELRVLLKHVQDNDHQLGISHEYLQWLQKMKRTRDVDKKPDTNFKGGATAPMAGGWPASQDIDEDMMDDF